MASSCCHCYCYSSAASSAAWLCLVRFSSASAERPTPGSPMSACIWSAEHEDASSRQMKAKRMRLKRPAGSRVVGSMSQPYATGACGSTAFSTWPSHFPNCFWLLHPLPLDIYYFVCDYFGYKLLVSLTHRLPLGHFCCILICQN
jgi:hypothetical protein